MAALTLHDIATTGTVITYENAAGGGDTFANDVHERTYLLVNNASGGSINVTFDVRPTSVNTREHGTLTVSDNVVAVDAGELQMIGPFIARLYNNSSQVVSVSYSGVTSLTVAAIRMPRDV